MSATDAPGWNTGPLAAPVLRRSQYLADALKALQTSGETIRSPGELGVRLLADAILQRGDKRNSTKLADAQKADLANETASNASFFGGGAQTPAAPEPQFPASQVPVAPPQPQAPPSIPGASDGLPNMSGLSPRDRLAMAQAIYGEARGEPPAGQQAVASVILNRAKQSGMSPADVVAAPHQFAGFNPQSQALGMNDPRLQPILNNVAPLMDGSQPPTPGIDHFFNPQLASPSWGQGPGEMIGQQKFMALNGPAPPQGAPPAPQAPSPGMAEPQPYQVASLGATPPPPQPPPGPVASPPPVAAAPAQPLPSPAAAGASPTPLQVYQHFMQMGTPEGYKMAQTVLGKIAEQAGAGPQYEASFDPASGDAVYTPKDPRQAPVVHHVEGLAPRTGVAASPEHPASPEEVAKWGYPAGTIGSVDNQTGVFKPAAPNFQHPAPSLNENTITDQALAYLAGQPIQNTGFGPQGVANKAAIMNMSSRLLEEAHRNGGDLPGAAANFKAREAALTQQTKLMANVANFEQTARANGQIVRELIQKGVGPGGSFINAPINALRAGLGDEGVTNLRSAVASYTSEVAKVLSGSTGTAASTDSMRREAAKLVDPNATAKQILDSMAILDREMDNRTKSMRDSVNSVSSLLYGAPELSKPAGAQPGAAPHIRTYNPATGKLE